MVVVGGGGGGGVPKSVTSRNQRVASEPILAPHIRACSALIHRHLLRATAWCATRDMVADTLTKGRTQRIAITQVLTVWIRIATRDMSGIPDVMLTSVTVSIPPCRAHHFYVLMPGQNSGRGNAWSHVGWADYAGAYASCNNGNWRAIDGWSEGARDQWSEPGRQRVADSAPPPPPPRRGQQGGWRSDEGWHGSSGWSRSNYKGDHQGGKNNYSTGKNGKQATRSSHLLMEEEHLQRIGHTRKSVRTQRSPCPWMQARGSI